MTNPGAAMTNREIFQKVALRELTPQQAADQMLANDLAAQAGLRPRWLPNVVWILCMDVLSAFGLRRDAHQQLKK